MKKIIILLFIPVLCFSQISEGDYLNIENKRLSHAQEIEELINQFILDKIDDFILSKELIEYLEKDANIEKLSKEEYLYLIKKVKINLLRELFFEEYPELKKYYVATPLPIALQTCTNGGFETGVQGWTFSQHQYSPFPGSGFSDDCNMNINTNIPFTASTILNDPNSHVTLVSNGLDPLLQALAIPLNRTFTGNSAIRLNQPNDGGYDVTTISRTFNVINQPSIDFNFALVLENPINDHALSNDQPFFEIRVFDQNNNLFYRRCIVSNPNDCVFISANEDDSLLYTNWNCVSIDVSQLINQTARVEISVADCGRSGHSGYAYIDNICNGPTCDNSVFGSIDLNPLNLNCPNFPIDVCGTYFPPLSGTSQQGVLQSMTLDIVDQQGNVVSNILTPTSINSNNFCFQVNEADFNGSLCSGNYEVVVNADFMMNCGIPFVTTLTDNNANAGADISFDGCGNLGFPISIDPSSPAKYDFIETDSNGDFIIGIFSGASPDLPGGSIFGLNPIIAKYTSDGCLLWHTIIPFPSAIVEMKVDNNDDIVLLLNKTDIGGFNNPPSNDDHSTISVYNGQDGSASIGKAYSCSRNAIDFCLDPMTNAFYVLFESKVTEPFIIYNDLNQAIYTNSSSDNFYLRFSNNLQLSTPSVVGSINLLDGFGPLDMIISDDGTNMYLSGSSNSNSIDFGNGVSLTLQTNDVFLVQYAIQALNSLSAVQGEVLTSNSSLGLNKVNVELNSTNTEIFVSFQNAINELDAFNFNNPINVYNLTLPNPWNYIDDTLYNDVDGYMLLSLHDYGRIYKLDSNSQVSVFSNYSSANFGGGAMSSIAQSLVDDAVFVINPNSNLYTITRLSPIDGSSYKFLDEIENEQKKNKFVIVPNPVENNFKIDCLDNSKGFNIKELKIYDMYGVVCFEKENIEKQSHEFSISKLKTGLYFVSIVDRNNKTHKITLIKK